MARKYWIGIGIAAVILVLIVRYASAGHQTPAGQPQLLVISSQSISQFTQAFNRYPNAKRVVLLMSPTCPVCLEGSSAVDRILASHPGENIRAFAVWEPMLPTDWSSPNTHVLARLSDPRVIQVWDKDHLLAGLVEQGAGGRHPSCCSRKGAWWDVIAAYPPLSKWTASAPAPDLLNGTIVSTAPELEAELEKRP